MSQEKTAALFMSKSWASFNRQKIRMLTVCYKLHADGGVFPCDLKINQNSYMADIKRLKSDQ